jgi:hypothetical protein
MVLSIGHNANILADIWVYGKFAPVVWTRDNQTIIIIRLPVVAAAPEDGVYVITIIP